MTNCYKSNRTSQHKVKIRRSNIRNPFLYETIDLTNVSVKGEIQLSLKYIHFTKHENTKTRDSTSKRNNTDIKFSQEEQLHHSIPKRCNLQKF